MTKAMTKRQKLAARKAGRKRSNGERHPGGRLKNASTASERARAMDAKRTVLERRCRAAGTPPTIDNLKSVDRANQGFALGRLHDAGHLRGDGELQAAAEARFEAGKAFATIDADHRAIMGLPPRHARGSAYARSGESTGDDDRPETIQAIKKRYSAAQDVVRQMGVVPRDMMMAVCVDDEDLPDSDNARMALRIALREMALHFRLAQ